MEDNMIAIAASFVFQLMLDAWEVYVSVPDFLISFIRSDPGTFDTISVWNAWIFLTIFAFFKLLEFLIKFDEAKASRRFLEIKQATLSALAESANSDEAHCTLPSKATHEKNQARTEALLKQMVKAIESKSDLNSPHFLQQWWQC